jgi:hypothetical protein
VESNSGVPIVELIAVVYAERCRGRILRPIAPSWWLAYLPREDTADLAQRSREIWRESSNRLFEFTRARGIDYLHVLQPNQHLPGGKILSEQEHREFTDPPGYGEHVRLHYAAFSRAGVNAMHFRDQRYLFKDNAETLYNDNCCHFNEKGIQYISDDIIGAFHDVFAARLRRERPAAAGAAR